MLFFIMIVVIISYLFCSENFVAQKAQNQSHTNLELHKQIIDEVKIGLWMIDEAQEKIKAIENQHSPCPVKHQKRVVREYL